MPGQVLKIELAVGTNGLVTGFKVASDTVNQFAQEFRTNMATAATGAAPMNREVDTLYDKMRGMSREARQHNRVFGFYAKSLADLSPVAKEATAAFIGLGAGIASGMWVMAAVEGIKLIVSLFKEWKKDSKEIEENIAKLFDTMASRAASAQKEFRFFGQPKSAEMAEEVNARQARIDKTKELIEEEKKYRTEELKRRWAARELNSSEVVQLANASREREKQLESSLKIAQQAQRIQTAELDAKIATEGLTKDKDEQNKKREEAVRLAKELAKADQTVWDGWAKAYERVDLPAVYEEMSDKLAGEMAGVQAQRELEHPMFGPGNVAGAAEFESNLKKLTKQAKDFRDTWEGVGQAISTSFSAIGQAAGGRFGALISGLGQIISQVISLVVALTAENLLESTPGGWLAVIPATAGILAALIGMIASVPKYEFGTSYVPYTGLAMLHEGEAVVPASRNRGGSPTIIYAMDGPSIRRALRANRGELARALRELASDRRG